MNEESLISNNYEKILDLVSLPIKNDIQKISRHKKLLSLLKEDGFNYTEDTYINIFKTTLSGLDDELKESILRKDSIKIINSNFNKYLRYIDSGIINDQHLNYSYTLIICYYIYLTS